MNRTHLAHITALGEHTQENSYLSIRQELFYCNKLHNLCYNINILYISFTYMTQKNIGERVFFLKNFR